jgi:thiamine-phosphate pyrophosphorylase
MAGKSTVTPARAVGDRGVAANRVRGLYYITSDVPERDRTHEGLAALAAAGGATVVQFREKSPGGPRREEAARAVRDVCRDAGALFIVNDDPSLACELGADGLHLGQSDLDQLDEWRRLIGLSAEAGEARACLLGISVASVAEASRAVRMGADYLGVGPVFATPSKADAGAPIGLDRLRAIRAAVDVPLAAVGGVGEANAAAVLAAGADALCVMSAISAADDPRAAARSLVALCAGAAGNRGISGEPLRGRLDDE